MDNESLKAFLVELVYPKPVKSSRKWHICESCLDPIIDDLGTLLSHWANRGTPQVTALHFEGALGRHNFEYGLTWLKVFTSVAFANELRKGIEAPLAKLRDLQREAQRLHQRDKPGWGRLDDWILFAIQHEYEDRCDRADGDVELTDDSFAIRFDELRGEMLQARWRLQLASRALRDKVDMFQTNEEDVEGEPDIYPARLRTKLTSKQNQLLEHLWEHCHASFTELLDIGVSTSADGLDKMIERTGKRLIELGECMTLDTGNEHVSLNRPSKGTK